MHSKTQRFDTGRAAGRSRGRNKGRRVLFAVSLLVCLIAAAPQAVFAETADKADYTTENLAVTVNVKDDNSAYVTENADIKVLTPFPLFERRIPQAGTLQFFDKKGNVIGEVRKNVEVEDVTVERDAFSLVRTNEDTVISIGDADKLIKESHTFTYSYRVRMYDDGNKEYDVLYCNVIPANWGSAVKNASITINMPEKFDRSDVHILVGKTEEGLIGDRNEVYNKKYYDWQVEGNTITINTLKELPAGSYLTVGIMLPEGYFTDELSDRKSYLLLYALGLAAGLLMLYLWFKKGRDPKAAQTVEFYPPEDISSAEFGYIIDGTVDRRDVLSLLIDFANRGCLAIEETGKDAFAVRRLADLPQDAKDYEEIFFNGLFADGDYTDLTDLPADFYSTYQATREAIAGTYTARGKRLFSGMLSKWRLICLLAAIAVTLAGGLIVSRLYGNMILMACAAGVGVLLVCSYVLAMLVEDRKYVSKKGGRRFGKTVLSLGLLLLAMAGTYLYMYLSVGAKLAACLFIFMEAAGYFAIRFMRSRTKNGTQLLGKVLGFKEFISVAELAKLEMLVKEDPAYFYDILPYAYALGLSKKWAKKFETIHTEAPSWYSSSYGGTVFSSWMFYRSFDRCMDMAGAYMAAAPAAESAVSEADEAGGTALLSDNGVRTESDAQIAGESMQSAPQITDETTENVPQITDEPAENAASDIAGKSASGDDVTIADSAISQDK